MDEAVLKLVQNTAQLQIHFVDTQLPLCAVISQCMCPRVLSALCQHQRPVEELPLCWRLHGILMGIPGSLGISCFTPYERKKVEWLGSLWPGWCIESSCFLRWW